MLEPLESHWGDPDGFVAEALPVLTGDPSGAFTDEGATERLLGQLYRQVLRVRALYFRPISSATALENAYKELEAQAAERHQVSQQVVLWLASRIQHTVLAYLASPRGREALDRLYAEAGRRRERLQRAVGDPEQITLNGINGLLTDFVRDVLGEVISRLETAALAGYLLETLRAAARRPPDLAAAGEEVPEQGPQAGLLGALTDATRTAELNDAQHRFGQLSDADKRRRFNEFRLRLGRSIREVAPYAPLGFEPFCRAVEAALFPYPAPLEFIRAYLRPIYNNGRQSTLFSEVTTPQGVEQRYETLIKSKQGNPVITELARRFALASFQAGASDDEERTDELRGLDLRSEFKWPASVREVDALLRRLR